MLISHEMFSMCMQTYLPFSAVIAFMCTYIYGHTSTVTGGVKDIKVTMHAC